jgi:polysaccharide deacetylase 2 family uncharacterized protein YibQ
MGQVIRFLHKHARELAFAALAGFGLGTGGASAFAGFPHLVAAVTPGLSAHAEAAHAEAPPPAADRVRLALSGFAASRHAPQLLYPVPVNPFPAWMAALRPAERPVVAIVIDDLGADLVGTGKAMRLPKPVALAFLPYAEMTPAFAAKARDEGRTVLVHMPMQAERDPNPGPMALGVGMAPDEILRRLNWSLERVPGAAGLNNHEGSRFTANETALAPVMHAVKARGLFFLDSKTIGSSKAEEMARAAGLVSGGRDVFLDDDQSEAAVRRQLAELVVVAKRQGAAIAIGHPHATTMRLLAEWLAEDHGVELVTLEAAMKAKDARLLAAR